MTDPDERWFTVRIGTPIWRRCIVDMHTRTGFGVLAEPIARYWSARRAADLAHILNTMIRGGRDD